MESFRRHAANSWPRRNAKPEVPLENDNDTRLSPGLLQADDGVAKQRHGGSNIFESVTEAFPVNPAGVR
ncbi:hypothetical protein soil367_05380 [Hydrocarboniclastica marina]|uniref:Uncharacterized protein n=1 Tax=Hydrocarboniclastica marina TaxID=2259620 RepID=A0A4P7XHU7_9ALTE|nr:hypothetical protein soil367_05380 [Hydrocarboniclastica marina]